MIVMKREIADKFASNYMNLYSGVPFCITDVDKLKSSINISVDANDYKDAVIRAS